MYYFEVCEIGRESVKSVNASTLATLIRELVDKYERNHKSKAQNRRFYIKCKESLEMTPKKCKKIGDDEGFESDGNEEDSLSGDLSNEDAQSTTSSCCMVEDHVFKSSKHDRRSFGKDPTSLVSIIGSIDSANSSGGSDTDELEVHSSTPSPTNQSKNLLQKKRDLSYEVCEFESIEKKQMKSKREAYPIADVIFCHTEPKFPTVIAWVIKKHQSDFGSRLGITGVENFTKIENCLEVIVIKCKNADNSRELCSNYQEYSKRSRLDNYKSIKRKKDGDVRKLATLSRLASSRDIKVSLSDMKIASSGLIKASELSILNPKIMTSFRIDLKNPPSLNSMMKPEKTANPANPAPKGSPETKGNANRERPLQSSTLKSQSLLNISKTWDLESSESSKKSLLRDKLPDPGDQFNLVQRTDLNGVTHLEVTKNKENRSVGLERPAGKSKLKKEIEGVILTDVESYAKKEQIRQRNCFDERDSKEKIYDSPPIRPERRKYVRKKPNGPSATVANQGQEEKVKQQQFSSNREKGKSGFFLTQQNNENQGKREEKIVKGPFIEVQYWGNHNVHNVRGPGWKPESRGRLPARLEDKYVDKKRSISAGRPNNKAPMAYRYVYVTGDYHNGPPVKRGLPSKIREVGGNITNSIQNIRRRNSFDDVITYNGSTKSNLKSVIKKNKRMNDKYYEPKKVTFSAFATVQVVD